MWWDGFWMEAITRFSPKLNYYFFNPFAMLPCSAQKILRSGGNCSAELSPNLGLSRHGVEVFRGYNSGRWCFYAFAHFREEEQ